MKETDMSITRAKIWRSVSLTAVIFMATSSITSAEIVAEVNGTWYDFSYTQTSYLNGMETLKSQPWWVSTTNDGERDDTDHYPDSDTSGYTWNGNTPETYWDGVDSSFVREAVAAVGSQLNELSNGYVFFAFHEAAQEQENLNDFFNTATYYWTGSAVSYDSPQRFAPINYATAVETSAPAGSEPTAVPEINGNTIPLLAFILGVIGLSLRSWSNDMSTTIPA